MKAHIALRLAHLALVASWLTLAVLAPYTKVEESFNLQATHDILEYGLLDTSQYDHLQFPGVVPRSFIPSLCLATIAAPGHWLIRHAFKMPLIYAQYHVRMVLCLLNAIAVFALARTFRGVEGRSVVLLLFATQFHYGFWTSRTIPNSFATVPVTWAFERWRRGRVMQAVGLLIATAVIVRSEVAALLACITLPYLPRHFKPLTITALGTFLLSLLLTVGIDTYFWRTPYLWPEWNAFVFNVLNGQASQWGTMPLWHYFTHALPKLLMLALAFLPFGMWRERRAFGTALGYVGILSCLPHKEWRFVIYVVPLLNVVATNGILRAHRYISQRLHRTVARALLATVLLVQLSATATMLWISSMNYPGGAALEMVHRIGNTSEPAVIYLDRLTATTGASRFGELNRPVWTYIKESQPPRMLKNTTYVISEDLHHVPDNFEERALVQGFSNIDWKERRVVQSPVLRILAYEPVQGKDTVAHGV